MNNRNGIFNEIKFCDNYVFIKFQKILYYVQISQISIVITYYS